MSLFKNHVTLLTLRYENKQKLPYQRWHRFQQNSWEEFGHIQPTCQKKSVPQKKTRVMTFFINLQRSTIEEGKKQPKKDLIAFSVQCQEEILQLRLILLLISCYNDLCREVRAYFLCFKEIFVHPPPLEEVGTGHDGLSGARCPQFCWEQVCRFMHWKLRGRPISPTT